MKRRFVLSVVGGVLTGVVLAAVSLYALILPVMLSTRNDEGLLRLERGATSWRRVAGGPTGACQRLWSFGDGVVMTADALQMEWTLATGEWTPSTRERPARAAAGSAARWFILDGGKAFSLSEGDCQLYAEPQHEALPRFATCPGKPTAVEAVTQLDDDSTVALVVDDAVKKYRAWQLPAGATAWKDLGALEVARASGELVPGPRAGALFVSSTGTLLALEHGRWQTLPTELTPRSGQRAALLADGSVVACGGSRPLGAQNPLLSFGLPLGVLAVSIIAAFFARARPLPFLFGGLGGATATAVVALVLFFTSDWH